MHHSKRRIVFNYHTVGFAAIAFMFYAVKLASFGRPIWWSEQGYFLGSIEIFKNHLNPWVEYFSYKPPLLIWLSAVGYTFLGYTFGGLSPFIPRLVVSLFSVLALYLTFLLGRKLYGIHVGICSTIVVFLSPVFFYQSDSFVAAVPVTALMLTTFYLYLEERRVLYLVFGTLLVLTKETTVLFFAAVLTYDTLVHYTKKDRTFSVEHLRRVLFLSIPLFVFMAWMISNKIILGWYLYPHSTSFIAEPTFTLWGLIWILENTFIVNFKFLLVAGILLAMFFGGAGFRRKEIVFFVLLSVLTVVFYWVQCAQDISTHMERDYFPLPRYYLYLWPFFIILGVAAWHYMFKRSNWGIYLASAGLSVLLLHAHVSDKIEVNGENDRNHRNMIQANVEVGRYLEANHVESLIVVPCDSREFTVPAFGYLQQRLDVLRYCAFRKARFEERLGEAMQEGRRIVFVNHVWTAGVMPSSRSRVPRAYTALLGTLIPDATPIETIQRGHEKAEIYPFH